MKIWLQISGLLLVLVSCSNEPIPTGGIARVGEVYLSEVELQSRLPAIPNPKDSLYVRQSVIDDWVREQVILQKAAEVLPENELDVKRQLEAYRESLITYAFEKEMVRKRLDTVIADTAIQIYYDSHQENFKLQDYIVKVLYLKLPETAPQLKEVTKWYKLNNPEDLTNIRNYAPLHADNYYHSSDKWVYFDDVLKVIPIADINKATFIRNKRKVTFQDGGYVYFLNIMDYKLKDALSPISLEKDKIKSILLNIRANELKKNIREELYNDAKSNNKIELF